MCSGPSLEYQTALGDTSAQLLESRTLLPWFQTLLTTFQDSPLTRVCALSLTDTPSLKPRVSSSSARTPHEAPSEIHDSLAPIFATERQAAVKTNFSLVHLVVLGQRTAVVDVKRSGCHLISVRLKSLIKMPIWKNRMHMQFYF